jgi:cell division protein FtsB
VAEALIDDADGRRTDVRYAITSLLFWTYAAIAVGLYAAVLLFPRLAKHERLAIEVDRLAQENAEIQRANVLLAKQVEALDNDPFYIGQVARRDLGYHRPGERRLRVGRSHEPDPVVQSSRSAAPAWLGRIQRLYAQDASLRRASVVTASVLLLCACLFFHGGRSESAAQAESSGAAAPVALSPPALSLNRLPDDRASAGGDDDEADFHFDLDEVAELHFQKQKAG